MKMSFRNIQNTEKRNTYVRKLISPCDWLQKEYIYSCLIIVGWKSYNVLAMYRRLIMVDSPLSDMVNSPITMWLTGYNQTIMLSRRLINWENVMMKKKRVTENNFNTLSNLLIQIMAKKCYFSLIIYFFILIMTKIKHINCKFM